MYKIAMHMYGDVWNALDGSMNYEHAVKSIQAYRAFMPNKTFRLEHHTMKVLDV